MVNYIKRLTDSSIKIVAPQFFIGDTAASEVLAKFWSENIDRYKKEYPKLSEICFRFYILKRKRSLKEKIFFKHPLEKKEFYISTDFVLNYLPKGETLKGRTHPLKEAEFWIITTAEYKHKFMLYTPVDSSGDSITSQILFSVENGFRELIIVKPTELISLVLSRK